MPVPDFQTYFKQQRILGVDPQRIREEYAYLQAQETPERYVAEGEYLGPGREIIPTTPITSTTTGDEKYDQLLNLVEGYVLELEKRGQMINPNVEITPEKVTEFLKQAETEISPYYKTQMKLAREDLLRSLGYTKEEILVKETELEAQYGAGVRKLGEQAAETGFLYGGRRRLGETELAGETQREIEAGRRQLGFQAGTLGRQFAQQWGQEAVEIPTMAQTPRVLGGVSAFEKQVGVAPLYTLSPEIYQGLIGEKQYEETAEKRRRAAELEQAYRTSEEARLRKLQL